MGLPVARIKLETRSTPVQEKANPSLEGWALLWTLLGIFAGGLALNLTPCVYPLIPITVSYFGGRSTQGKRELIGHGFCYIGGLALTNSLLGVFAALTGSLIGALLQSPLVLIAIAVVFLDKAGKERNDLRLVDFIAPGEFLNRMVSLINPG